MSYSDIVEEIKRLSLHEQFRLMEVILEAMQRKVKPTAQANQAAPPMSTLRGILKPLEGAPPTDAKIEEMIATHLMDKYNSTFLS